MVTNNANSDLTAKKQKEKKVIPMMMVIVVIVGFFIGVASFCMAYTYMMSDETSEPTEERFSANGVLKQAQANLIGSDIDAVVKSIDKEANTIVFYNLKNDTSSTVNVTDTTIFPKNVTMDTIAVGDIYTYKFDKDETLLKSRLVRNLGQLKILVFLLTLLLNLLSSLILLQRIMLKSHINM